MEKKLFLQVSLIFVYFSSLQFFFSPTFLAVKKKSCIHFYQNSDILKKNVNVITSCQHQQIFLPGETW